MNCLDIIEVGAKKLCQRNIELVEADIICDYMLKSLHEESSDIGNQLYESLKKRILQRRNMNMYGLARYLNLAIGVNYESITKESLLPYPKKKDLAKIAKELYFRLYPDTEDSEESDVEELPKEPPIKRSHKEELDELLAKHKEPKNLKAIQPILSLLQKEMALYDASRCQEMPDKLQKLKNALATVSPTSVETERAFSAAGLFVTKLRTTLNDKTINNLCFLRAHLLNLKNA